MATTTTIFRYCSGDTDGVSVKRVSCNNVYTRNSMASAQGENIWTIVYTLIIVFQANSKNIEKKVPGVEFFL